MLTFLGDCEWPARRGTDQEEAGCSTGSVDLRTLASTMPQRLPRAGQSRVKCSNGRLSCLECAAKEPLTRRRLTGGGASSFPSLTVRSMDLQYSQSLTYLPACTSSTTFLALSCPSDALVACLPVGYSPPVFGNRGISFPYRTRTTTDRSSGIF